jgi:arylsulfatase
MWRTAVVIAAALSTVIVLQCAPASTPEPGCANLILITVDTLRADHLGCYGYARVTSPGIDSFARQSVRFEHAYSACSFTCPSLTAIHTSRFPGLNSTAFANGWPVPPVEAPTLATTLKARGFRTAAFVGNHALAPSAGLAAGFDTYEAVFDSAEVNRALPERTCESLTRATLEWLEANGRERFFLWIHYQDPHGPYTPPPPYRDRFPGEGGQDLQCLDNIVGYGGIPSYQALKGHVNSNYYIAQYDGEIAYLDASIALLLATIRDKGLLSNTAIALTADHGESLGEDGFHFAHGHGLSREQIHVPLLLYAPGLPSGSCAAPVSGVDLAPTLLRLARVDAPETFLGASLLETLRSGARRGPFFVETSYALGAFEDGWHFSWGKTARIAGKRENIKVTSPQELGLRDAPRVMYHLAGKEGWQREPSGTEPRWLSYLQARCEEHLRQSTAYYRDADLPEPDAETKQALRTLGYLN